MVEWRWSQYRIFHQYANHRRNINSIWEIKDVDGHIHRSQEGINNVAVQYFQKAYGNNENIIAKDLVWGTDPYSIM